MEKGNYAIWKTLSELSRDVHEFVNDPAPDQDNQDVAGTLLKIGVDTETMVALLMAQDKLTSNQRVPSEEGRRYLEVDLRPGQERVF